MSDERLTPSDREELHRLRNETQIRLSIRVEVEKTLCQMWKVDYQPDGSHWKDLRVIRDELERMRDERRTRKGWLNTVVTAAIAAIASGITAFLSGAFGAHKP